MKYFTPERYVALQTFDKENMDAADTAWESAVQAYETYLATVRPEIPESIRHLLEGFYLHDADVLSMGRRGADFSILVQLDVPPYELLTITYNLTAPPHIDPSALPLEHRSTAMQWLHDELEALREEGRTYYVHSILFSNGWEVRLPFRDVQTITSLPIYPAHRISPQIQSTSAAAHSA